MHHERQCILGICFTNGKMLHNWENASPLEKCFTIGNMLLVLLGFINLQILVFHSYMIPVYSYTQSNIIVTDNHKIAFFFSNILSNGFDTKGMNGWYTYIPACKNKPTCSKPCHTGTQIIL